MRDGLGAGFARGEEDVVMVGDDRRIWKDPGDLELLDYDAYCGECGQVGCKANG